MNSWTDTRTLRMGAWHLHSLSLIELHSNYSSYLHLTLHIALDMLIPCIHADHSFSKVQTGHVIIVSPGYLPQTQMKSIRGQQNEKKRGRVSVYGRERHQKFHWFWVDHWGSLFLQHQRACVCFDVAACCLRYRVNGKMSSCKVPL